MAETTYAPISIVAGTYSSPAINIKKYRYIGAVCRSWGTPAKLGMMFADNPSAVHVHVHNYSCEIRMVNITSGGAVYLSSDIYPFRSLKLVSHSGGININQVAEARLDLMQKD